MTLLEKRGKQDPSALILVLPPKSMSSMVPKENSYRSDLAMGDLGCKFS